MLLFYFVLTILCVLKSTNVSIMKTLKNKILAVSFALISLSSGAAQAPYSQNSTLLCDLFGIGCPVVTSDSNGQGKEPPATPVNG